MSEEKDSNKEPNQPRNYGSLALVMALLLAIGTFAAGLQVGQGVSGPQVAGLYEFFFPKEEVASSDSRPNLDEFWKVWDLLEEKYISASSSEVTIEERIQGAIEGLVDTYEDPYTVYMPPADAASFGEEIAGNFSGVGMEVGIRENLVTIISPLPETPAEKAGLIAGDVIVRIDGVTTEDMRIDEAVQLIRGEKGTVVELVIFREGEDEFITIPVTRDTIEIPTVKTEKRDDVFIISLYSFNAVSEEKMRDAVIEYSQSGAKSLVLDLRGNPGGYLQSAVTIASYFLPSGKVVVIEESGEATEQQIFRSRSRGQESPFNNKNLVVLVDNGSASASEILAGALKDHDSATVIGIDTFGKGSVQELVELDDGSSLKVTVARWLTPSGVSISEGGLKPHIEITRSPAQRLAGEDPQLDAAIRFLHGEEVVSEDFESQIGDETGSE
jgi:carboxyl-terminal processing protease